MKKNITIILLSLIVIITTIIFINNNAPLQVISPVNSNSNADITSDGKDDCLEFMKRDNTIDLNISYNNNNTYLSSKTKDNILFSLNNHWSPKIYLQDLSRDLNPEIILQGVKKDKSICYIFSWNNNEFKNLYCSDKNIFGILDSKNSKTPQCFSLSASKGNSSINSFMIINNELLDVTNSNLTVPSLNNITHFIKLIETPYELDTLPDIFSSKIDSSDLSILDNLDKENNSYSFQDGFFYDYEWDNSSKPISLKWKLTFEKNKLKGEESDKDELAFYIDSNLENSMFKIVSIKKIK